MTDLEKLLDLLDDMQRSGTSYFDYEMYGVRIPDSVPNEDVAKYLLKHNVVIQNHGFWKKHSLNNHKCSCCHNVTNTYFGYPKFCPECGAKMTKVEDS